MNVADDEKEKQASILMVSNVPVDQPPDRSLSTSLSYWPSDKLEWLGECPVCGDAGRETMYRNLVDNVFKCAPGQWSLHRCASCRNAYLDPRPTKDSIGLAYQNYYTHVAATERPSIDAKRGVRWLLRALANGYRNWRFGTDSAPASRAGILFFFLAYPWKRAMDREFRYLPKDGSGLTLLDVGFGSGRFLDDARLAGWRTSGVDFDPVTVANARSRQHEVFEGGIEIFDGQTERFDVITINHVIEHTHDPIGLMESAYRLLKPGGQLWLDTPNIDSEGARLFGKDWRGLEPPRHLVLLRWTSALDLLSNLRFVGVRKRIPYLVAKSIYAESAKIRAEQGIQTRWLRIKIWVAVVRTMLDWRKSEFITLTALKPGSAQ